MEKLKRITILLYTFTALCSYTTAKSDVKNLETTPKYLIYEVSGENNTVYLTGSVHVGLPEFYPLPDYIEDAFKKSDYLVVEVDITSPENINAAQKIVSHAVIENGKTLDRVISPELYVKVTDILADFGFAIDNFNRMQPWFFTIFLPGLQMQSFGYSEEYGIDKYFLNKAQGKKEILELESFMDQINVFKEMNSESYLSYTLLSMEETEILIPVLIKAWQDGDADKLGKLLHSEYDSADSDTAQIYNKLFTERDDKMTKKITGYLNDDKDYFIVVGSGHLVGSNGIAARLKKQEYPIKQLK